MTALPVPQRMVILEGVWAVHALHMRLRDASSAGDTSDVRGCVHVIQVGGATNEDLGDLLPWNRSRTGAMDPTATPYASQSSEMKLM